MGNTHGSPQNGSIPIESKEISSAHDEYKALMEEENPVQAHSNELKVIIGEETFQVLDKDAEVAKYCVPLTRVSFYGETPLKDKNELDIKYALNLGLYLKLLDIFLRQISAVTDFTGDEEEYVRLLKLVAFKRRRTGETTKQCYKRLLNDNRRFVNIYHQRGFVSEALEHDDYWGSRQQMLSAKVIADWIDQENGPLDPIFGAILQPTAGRIGPGDSGFVHSIFFSDRGFISYHSAVHDAFGYLYIFHKVGPGYTYIGDSSLDEDNPYGGQLSGLKFWKKIVKQLEMKETTTDDLYL